MPLVPSTASDSRAGSAATGRGSTPRSGPLRQLRGHGFVQALNGSRERGFAALKYERLFFEEIPDAIDLAVHVEHYRIEYNTVRPHEALSWNRPIEVHLGFADPATPSFPEPQNLPST